MNVGIESLLTVGTLSAVVVGVLGALKRIPGKEGSWWWKFRLWMDSNLFLMSLFIAFLFGTGAFLIIELGYQEAANKYWQVLLVIWSASQAIYNLQKGAINLVERDSK